MAANRQRAWIWGCSAAVSFGASLAYGQLVHSFDDPTCWRMAAFALMGLSMLGLVAGAPRWKSDRRELLAIGLVALACRGALLAAPANDDAQRYLWEGRLVTEGLSPYSKPADDPVWAAERDRHWERMNNKGKLTAYPPGALLVFAGAAWARYEASTFKWLFVGAELASLAAAAAMLRRRGLPLRHIGWAAFNPVMLASFAGEGHFDSLMLLALALAALACDRRRYFWAGVALGLAVQLKVVAIVGLPFLFWRGRWRSAGGFALVVLSLSLPFLGTLDGLFEGLVDFGSRRWFNGPLHTLLESVGIGRHARSWLLPGVLLAALCMRFWIRGTRDSFVGHWQWISGALLLASPTVHLWYLSWIVLFLPLRPSLWWAPLSISQGFYFLVWSNAVDGLWGLKTWQSALVWSPALVLLVPQLGRALDALRAKLRPRTGERIETGGSDWLVVVPTLDAESSIGACLASLVPQLGRRDTLVVSDAGSTDRTARIAVDFGVRVVVSKKGRGNQIMAALEAAPSRYALVAHADAVAPAGLLDRLRARFTADAIPIGGACGQRFSERGFWPFRIVEMLNELKAGLWGIAFGDQMQFFDRAALEDRSFPVQPLMEDVELSLRLRALGDVDYLGQECVVSGGKWGRFPRRRFGLVIWLTARYAWARLRGTEQAGIVAETLYREYYGEAK